MKELDQFTVEELSEIIRIGDSIEFPSYMEFNGYQAATLARIALSAKVGSEPHKRREIHAGGNTWIQCSKQAYDRAEAAGGLVRILYERPELNSPETPDGWVACAERMPAEGDTVLVCQEGGIVYCAEMEGGVLYPDEFPRVPAQGREITHWMPLPAAPKPEK